MKNLRAIITTSAVLVAVALSSVAFAQYNPNAYIALDTDLASAGYQGIAEKVSNIGPNTNFGFAIYLKDYDSVKAFELTCVWDSGKATKRSTSSVNIVDDDLTINGASIIPAAETNLLGGVVQSPSTDTAWSFNISTAKQGAGSEAGDEGLLYLMVFRTAADFSTNDFLTVKTTVKLLDQDDNLKTLDPVFFSLNNPVGVKNATWGEVKSQFKDF